MTLVRNDNSNPLTLSVKDPSQLLGLQPGNKVVVDADRRFFGGWKVDSVTMASGSATPELSATPTTDAMRREVVANTVREEQLSASEDGQITAADSTPASNPIVSDADGAAHLNTQVNSNTNSALGGTNRKANFGLRNQRRDCRIGSCACQA